MEAQGIVAIVGGLVLLTVGAEVLVRGAERLAAAAGISPVVVGLTVVASGTSSPELAASVAAAWSGSGDMAFGNVIGSNVFNVLLILGVSAAITPLVVARRLVRIDVPVMVGVSALAPLLALDGRISRGEGALLLLGMVAYFGFIAWEARTDRSPVPEVEQGPEEGTGDLRGGLAGAVGLLILGLGLLVIGSRWLVEGAIVAARYFGVSELVVGLTIVAAGTSLPEAATSILAAMRGQRDIAVGNVVGSNIFNLLGVLGGASVVVPIEVPAAALSFDVPVMVATALACLPIFFSGYRIARWEGWLFLGYYIAYVTFLVFDATKHDALPAFSAIMAGFVLPLTAVTLAVVGIRAFRARHTSSG